MSENLEELDLQEIEESDIDEIISEFLEETLDTIDTIDTVEPIKKLSNKRQNYIDDLEMTALLVKEAKERQLFENTKPENVKSLGPSNMLGEWFIKITERMLSRGNFRNYSDNYKDEMRSDAYLFFARYWWKFNPEKVTQNWTLPPKDAIWENVYDTEGVIVSKNIFVNENDVKVPWHSKMKPEEEWKGGFSFFTTLAWSGAIGALKIRKKEDEQRQKIAEDMAKNSRDSTSTEYYIDRHFTEGY